MAKKKKTSKKRARRRGSKKKSKKASRPASGSADTTPRPKKLQRTCYFSQEVIDMLEKDRVERQRALREEHGVSQKLTWNANLEAVVVRYLEAKGVL